jgi:hypothetical protein
MRRPGGYALWVDPDAPTKERDTFTCAHCNGVVVVHPRPKPPPGGFCRMCMKSICDGCCDVGSCTPFERKLDAMERRDRLLRAAT